MPFRPPVLRVGLIGAMLNFEIAEHPVYDGLEFQWYDDAAHGRGMLALLTRRDSRLVDCYRQRGLRLDPADFQIGAGTGVWAETDFADARLEVRDDGVHAAAELTDADGRRVEVRVDDRDGQSRRRGGLLAPVGAAIEDPTSLFLVWLPEFDLVRIGGREPILRIDDGDPTVGQLPGARWHRRRLIKYAAPMMTIEVLPDSREASKIDDPVHQSSRCSFQRGVAECATPDGHVARVEFDPPFPDLSALTDGIPRAGQWSVSADGGRLTGGRWFAEERGDRVHAGLDVTERWKPRNLPLLMRAVTTVVPVFRRWPTTYQLRASIGPKGETTTGWRRTNAAGADAYRRATGT